MILWDAEFLVLYFGAGNRRDMVRVPADLLSLVPPHLIEYKLLLKKEVQPFSQKELLKDIYSLGRAGVHQRSVFPFIHGMDQIKKKQGQHKP